MKVVQIGANRGNDELTRMLESNFKLVSFLLLIEPLEKFNQHLINCYSEISNLYIENVAIVDDEKAENINMFIHGAMDENMEQASLKKSHIDMVFDRPEYILPGLTHDDQISEIFVKCSTFNSLMRKYKIDNLDILFIDAEGMDDIIIRSIDFESIRIKEIYYENMHINNEVLEFFLSRLGYQIQRGTEYSKNNNVARLIN
jgi:FkbM family methyltransferase